jgi:hypothetical protein
MTTDPVIEDGFGDCGCFFVLKSHELYIFGEGIRDTENVFLLILTRAEWSE